MNRPPNELLTVLDMAQDQLDEHCAGAFDLRSLLWEVLNDVLDSIQLAECQQEGNPPDSIHDTVRDYITNHYGDDA